MWDTSTGKDIHGPMQGHSSVVYCVRFSPDGSVVVSGSSDGTVLIWDVTTGQQVAELLKGDDAILSVGFSPDGRQVVCGSIVGRIRVLDRHIGDALVGPIEGHTNSICSVEFSSNGMRLVSGSDDKSVRVWDAPTGKQIVVCGERDGAHSKLVLSVGFSRNGLYVVSGSVDCTVRVWDAENGNLILGPLTGHTNSVYCVQFSPDGLHVVSCSDDGTIRFWDVSTLGSSSEEHTAMSTSVGEQVTHSSNSNNAINSWLLDEDGWVVDSCKRRLVWVPSDLREYFALPLNDLIIGDPVSFKLEFDQCNIGENWMDCYRP
ncbi:unnamed protein product [Rhizoctonia solani]|uniref:Vegetative incompatibility protein HET-E-1 [Podospora anserina] n=1 Tax=Rhizoctonia solani TaxID=456999 RepID=A0A8H3BSZ0_9AGAM|nr:unnamed protein product [Rhizoctonia solani]